MVFFFDVRMKEGSGVCAIDCASDVTSVLYLVGVDRSGGGGGGGGAPFIDQ